MATSTPLAMIDRVTIEFLRRIKKPAHNNKAWVDRNREAFDHAKADVEALADRLITAVAKFDPAIGSLRGTDCLTRLNRDVRFHGGPIFRHHYDLVLNPRGKKKANAYYYLHLEPGHVLAGAGVYAPEPSDLRAFREGISRHFAAFQNVISAKTFCASFPLGVEAPEKGASVPRGFRADDPAAAYLKLKGYYVRRELTDAEVVTQSAFAKVVGLFRSARPLVEFLNASLAEHHGPSPRRPTPLFPR